MIDHIAINVADYAKSRAFYRAVLAPLGFKIAYEEKTYTWFSTSDPAGAQKHGGFTVSSDQPFTTPIHFAFRAGTYAEVDAFYEAAIKAGGRDNGPPGLRPHYHADYYAAFIIDPDGHNIEAVCHAPG